jgi:hypothetical protein
LESTDQALHSMVGAASQTSVAVTATGMGMRWPFCSQLLDRVTVRVTVGGVVSCTVSCVRHVFLFDASSFALQSMIVVPNANGPLPQEAVQVPQLSLHVAEAA